MSPRKRSPIIAMAPTAESPCSPAIAARAPSGKNYPRCFGALTARRWPTPREHFGFTDAISDPAFEGQFPDHAHVEQAAVGSGKLDGEGRWSPLATGEFLLGWPDEAHEIAGASIPLDFSRNGTFMAYRKLHQHVADFREWITRVAGLFGVAWGIGPMDDARATLMAKLVGRWEDGAPLMVAPDINDWHDFNHFYFSGREVDRFRPLVDFGFHNDRAGARCPANSHIRRVNTRDMLDPLSYKSDPKSRLGSALNDRRRILRRGLPYGGTVGNIDEHGFVMLAICASLSRQFEFIQGSWINGGRDSEGNDTCPIAGNHNSNTKFVIQADPDSRRQSFTATNLPQFVSMRGGEYFFIPSMTALRIISGGVD
jgi:Dyp-type peroxidase family